MRHEPFILFREDTYRRQIILEEGARFGFAPRIAFSSNQIGTIMELVRQGVGIAFFIEEIVRRQQNILSRPLAEPLSLLAGLAWNRDRYQSNAARTFIESFRGSVPMMYPAENRITRDGK